MVREYEVTVQHAQPRPIAAVRVRLPLGEVPYRFAYYLDQVYAASLGGAIELDGQNIFVYSGEANGDVDVEFGVGAKRSFNQTGSVVQSATPSGEAATTVHWGDYADLGAAHAAVKSWCRSHGRSIAGPRWEVYGHWSNIPGNTRTDVFYLLKEERS